MVNFQNWLEHNKQGDNRYFVYDPGPTGLFEFSSNSNNHKNAIESWIDLLEQSQNQIQIPTEVKAFLEGSAPLFIDHKGQFIGFFRNVNPKPNVIQIASEVNQNFAVLVDIKISSQGALSQAIMPMLALLSVWLVQKFLLPLEVINSSTSFITPTLQYVLAGGCVAFSIWQFHRYNYQQISFRIARSVFQRQLEHQLQQSKG